jgi:hypothetical protein
MGTRNLTNEPASRRRSRVRWLFETCALSRGRGYCRICHSAGTTGWQYWRASSRLVHHWVMSTFQKSEGSINCRRFCTAWTPDSCGSVAERGNGPRWLQWKMSVVRLQITHTRKIWKLHGGAYEECCRFLQEPHGVTSQKTAFYITHMNDSWLSWEIWRRMKMWRILSNSFI